MEKGKYLFKNNGSPFAIPKKPINGKKDITYSVNGHIIPVNIRNVIPNLNNS